MSSLTDRLLKWHKFYHIDLRLTVYDVAGYKLPAKCKCDFMSHIVYSSDCTLQWMYYFSLPLNQDVTIMYLILTKLLVLFTPSMIWNVESLLRSDEPYGCIHGCISNLGDIVTARNHIKVVIVIIITTGVR